MLVPLLRDMRSRKRPPELEQPVVHFPVGRRKFLNRRINRPIDEHAVAPEIRSPLGRVLLSGTLDDWKLTGNAEIESAALPPGALRFEANGDREHAEIKLPEGQILGGTLSGVAEIDWSDGGSWSAAVAAEGIETQGLNAALPGAFNADLTASGALEPLRLDLDIRKLEGVIRGNQLTARGRMSYQTADL